MDVALYSGDDPADLAFLGPIHKRINKFTCIFLFPRPGFPHLSPPSAQQGPEVFQYHVSCTQRGKMRARGGSHLQQLKKLFPMQFPARAKVDLISPNFSLLSHKEDETSGERGAHFPCAPLLPAHHRREELATA